ncbi:MAG: DUF6293 family protein [Candidatus Thermoplasmatota archaeon]|nr:DUF6293 family protein [Candidatus Thermoplasmatota archaeon]
MSNLRIVISCVSFETVKVIDPILHYRADKVYLIYSSEEEPYIDFFNEVASILKKKGIPFEPLKIFYSDLNVVLKNVRDIIRKEKKAGNHVYVNIGAGPQIYSSAAIIASMMEGAVPFNAPTEEWTVKYPKKVFYENGKPIGNAKKVKPPIEIPLFNIQPPEPELVRALSIWKGITDRYGIRPTKEVMIELNRNDLLPEIWEDERRRKCSQSALMRYRRNFLEKFEDRGWIEKSGRARYSITDQGSMILEIFGP